MATKPIPVRLDDEQLAWIDAQAKTRDMNRSDFFRFIVNKDRAGETLTPSTRQPETQSSPPSSTPLSASVKDAELRRKVSEHAPEPSSAEPDPVQAAKEDTLAPVIGGPGWTALIEEGQNAPRGPVSPDAFCRHPINRRQGNGLCAMCGREAGP